MPELLQTTKDGKSRRTAHEHVLYIREDGLTACSEARKHRHEVMVVPPQPIIDPQTGTPVVGPDGQPQMSPPNILLSEANGHTHDWTELEQQEPRPERMDDEALLSQCRHLYKEAKAHESKSRKLAIESEDFYQGKQWEADIADMLEGSDRASLVLNFIESSIDFLVGVFRQNRTDWRWKPTEEGDSRVADILNVVTKNIANRARLPHTENRVFEDVAIAGRGFFHVYLDRSETLKGRIRIDHIPWKDVYCGPHDSITGEDREHNHKKRWHSMASIKSMFPKKYKELVRVERMMDDPQLLIETDDHYGANVDEEHLSALPVPTNLDPDLVDIARKDVALMETWQKEYHTVPIVIDPEVGPEGWAFNTLNTPRRLISQIETINVLTTIDRTKRRFRVTKWAGSVILADDYSPEPFNDFDVVPVYAKKRGKDFWGKVHVAKDSQRWVNKTSSKLSDILNKVDNYGYWYDDNTFDTESDRQRAKSGITQPGFMLKCTDAQRPPVREEGVKFPNELATTWQMMIQNLRQVMNVDPLAMGQTMGSRESGTAVQQKARQTLTGNEFLYDNFSLAKAQVGRMVVSLIQDSYTPDRIMRIIENQARKEPITIGGRQLQVEGAAQQAPIMGPDGSPAQQPGQQGPDPESMMQMEEVEKLFANADLLEYDVECGEGPYGPTARAANMDLFIQLAQTPVGQYLPPQLFIHMMDIPDKDRILAAVNQTMQQQQQAAMQKQQAEVQKTQIAAQSKMQGQNR